MRLCVHKYNSRLNTPYKTRKLICLRLVTDNIYTGLVTWIITWEQGKELILLAM